MGKSPDCNCWERRNMDPGLNPSGRLEGPVIRTRTRPILEEPSRTRRKKLLEDNSRATVNDGLIVRRPTRARIRNQ